MKISSVRHKGLKRFVEDDDAKGIRPDLINRVRNILAALLVADSIDNLNGPPGWRIHLLTGDRANILEHFCIGKLACYLRDCRRRNF